MNERFYVSDEITGELMGIIEKFWDQACKTLVIEHEKLEKLEEDNTNVLNTKGELPEELALEYEKRRKVIDLKMNYFEKIC